MPDETRPVPSSFHNKWRTWHYSAMGWRTVHYLAGFLSACLATVIAISTKTGFLNPTQTLIVAALAAGLSFLVTTMGAQDRVRLLEQAAWELEKAMGLYESDAKVPLAELGQAVARGVGILRGQDVVRTP